MVIIGYKAFLQPFRKLQAFYFLALGRRSICVRALIHSNRLANGVFNRLVNFCVLLQIGGHLRHYGIHRYQRNDQRSGRYSHSDKSLIMSHQNHSGQIDGRRDCQPVLHRFSLSLLCVGCFFVSAVFYRISFSITLATPSSSLDRAMKSAFFLSAGFPLSIATPIPASSIMLRSFSPSPKAMVWLGESPR